jgi:hypothetical protein
LKISSTRLPGLGGDNDGVALGDNEGDGGLALAGGDDWANPTRIGHPANPTIAIAISIQAVTGCFMRI